MSFQCYISTKFKYSYSQISLELDLKLKEHEGVLGILYLGLLDLHSDDLFSLANYLH